MGETSVKKEKKNLGKKKHPRKRERVHEKVNLTPTFMFIVIRG